MDINYVGELLWPGQLGHLMAIVSMTAALLATISYFFATQSKQENQVKSWRKIARLGFVTHTVAVFAIIIILFLLIFNHVYEYQYVWQHSSNDLPVYYMLSCFWEGQEGSFLLWTFWHVILGFFILKYAGKWESPVMAVVCLTQVFLAAMLIGIYFFGYKIGSSPFILMRDYSPSMPLFLRPDYVDFITDGNGLNPLLQNYWMVIHPPVLFLGFAATIMPFAYSIAGIWKKDFGQDFTLRTLRWGIFATGILGIGILMGAAWAYESLSFGGYWAWDPVENASLVPWIILICGMHTLLAYKHTGHSLKSTLIFFMLAFILILYSTFLTRSGILGDTSVHAFTDLGMTGQLLVFLLGFVFLSIILLIFNWRKIPSPEKEENTWSREFWMFVGSLVLLLMAVMISIDTSWPVINKIFGTDRAIVDAVAHYNRYTIWFGIVILLLTAAIQYFKYKKDRFKRMGRQILNSTLVTAIISIVIMLMADYSFYEYINFGNSVEIPFISKYFLLLFTSVYAIVANANYMLAVLKAKIKISGAAIAHVGFGLMLLGVLISSTKKQVISWNNLGLNYGEGFDEKSNLENVYLAKGKPIQMGDYWVTYEDNYEEWVDTYYKVKYERKQKQDDKPSEVFTLEPYAQVNPKMGLISNPDTKHYWTKDVFTHVSSIPKPLEEDEKQKDLQTYEVAVGDTILLKNYLMLVKGINPAPVHEEYLALPGDIAASAILEVKNISNQSFTMEPVYYVRNSEEFNLPVADEESGLSVSFLKIMPKESKIRLAIEQELKDEEFIILKAIVFPYINLLWLGCILMSAGFGIALWRRLSEKAKS